jgi:hypothetical protein
VPLAPDCDPDRGPEDATAHLAELLPPADVLLGSGRSLRVMRTGGDETVQLLGKDGLLELAIVLTDAGPVLRVAATRIELAGATVAMRCDELDIECKQRMSVRCDGHAEETVRGTKSTTVLGKLRTSAREVDLRAASGELRLAATDDLSINGKNVRINC